MKQKRRWWNIASHNLEPCPKSYFAMQSSSFLSENQSLMRWTSPQTVEQKAYYSNFAGLLGTLATTRRATQYLLWLPVAAAALANLAHDAIVHYIALPYLLVMLVCLVVVFMLHRLLSSSAQAHYFDKWDGDPLTNSTILLPLVIGLFLGFMEYKATASFFVSKVDKPAEITDGSEDDYKTLTAEAESRYSVEKQRITDNYSERQQLAAPTLFSNLEDYTAQKKRARNTADRDYLNTLIARTNKAINNNPTLSRLRAQEAEELAALLTTHNEEMKRLGSKRDGTAKTVAEKNAAAVAAYQTDTRKANSIAGSISVFCLVVFWFCIYKEVRIKTKSGIFPIRTFTELETHGNAYEKALHVIGDVLARTLHQSIYGYHRRSIKSMGDLKELNGDVAMKPHDYTKQRSPIPFEWNDLGKN